MGGMNSALPPRPGTTAVYQWHPGLMRAPRRIQINQGVSKLEVYVFADGGTSGKVVFGPSGLKYEGLDLWVPLSFVVTHPPAPSTPVLDEN